MAEKEKKNYGSAFKRSGKYIEKLQNTSNQFYKNRELMEDMHYSNG